MREERKREKERGRDRDRERQKETEAEREGVRSSSSGNEGMTACRTENSGGNRRVERWREYDRYIRPIERKTDRQTDMDRG